jgi:hypothetical protein
LSPYSSTIHFVNAIFAALAIVYDAPPMCPAIAGVEEILIITPSSGLFCNIECKTAIDKRTDPFRSTSMILSTSSSVTS